MKKADTHTGKAGPGSCVICKLTCVSCHTVNGRGGPIGPALDNLGSRLTRLQIIDQLLDPAKGPNAQSVMLLFKDGTMGRFTLAKENATTVTVRDRQTHEERTIQKDQLETFERVGSEMPSGLVDRLTPEEFANLVDFLVSRK